MGMKAEQEKVKGLDVRKDRSIIQETCFRRFDYEKEERGVGDNMGEKF